MEMVQSNHDNNLHSIDDVTVKSKVTSSTTLEDSSPPDKPLPNPALGKESRIGKYVVYSEKEPYDFAAARNLTKPTNVIESTGHLIKGCLGGGILGIHEAYMKCGLWTSLVLTVLFGLYITYCVYLLVRSTQKLCKRLHLPVMSYPDVAEAALEVGPFLRLRKYSKWFRYLVDVTICVDLFGACCVYQIIVARTVQQLADGDAMDIGRLRLYVVALLPLLLILCMITSLKHLAPVTLLADVFILVCVGATIAYALRSAPAVTSMPIWRGSGGLFEFSGVVVFSMEGVGVALPVHNNMKNPHKFPVVLASGMSVVLACVAAVGFFGYWGFGDAARAPVTLNFPQGEPFVIALNYLMACMLLATFALNFWAPFELVWRYLGPPPGITTGDGGSNTKQRIYRAIAVTAITGVAAAFPNIPNLMGLLGALCLSGLGFIFPAAIDTLVTWEQDGARFYWNIAKNALVVLAGIALLIAGTFANVRGLVNSL